jgi:hypothetical protein
MLTRLEPGDVFVRQAAGGSELLLVQPGRLAERPQSLSCPPPVLSPDRHDVTFMGASLGFRQILGADVAATIDLHGGELTVADPAANEGARESGALRGLGNRQQFGLLALGRPGYDGVGRGSPGEGICAPVMSLTGGGSCRQAPPRSGHRGRGPAPLSGSRRVVPAGSPR